MNTSQALTKDLIDEAKIHFIRGMELLDRAENSIDADVCTQVDKYMALPYNITVEKRGKLYAGKAKEFENIEEYGNTYNEAYNNTLRAMRHHIKSALENKKEIPVPKK